MQKIRAMMAESASTLSDRRDKKGAMSTFDRLLIGPILW
jgi:hypothetical protein